MATRQTKDSIHLERLKARLDITTIRVALAEESKIRYLFRITIITMEQKAMEVDLETSRASLNFSLQSKSILKGRA